MPQGTLYIVNPTAAGGRAAEHWRRLQPQLPRPEAIQVIFTTAPDHAFQLARAAAASEALVVAAGGDGTVREVASGLLAAGGRTPLGILPIGTGNDLAHQVGVPGPEAGLATIRQGRIECLDAIRVRTEDHDPEKPHHAVVYAAVGVAGEVLRRTTPGVKRWFGRAGAYSIGFLRAWWRLRGESMIIRGPDGQLAGRFLLAAAANCEKAGGGAMCLAPGANPADGLLDVTVADDMSHLKLLKYFLYLTRGVHPGKPGIRFFRAAELEVSSAEALAVQADGDAVGVTPVVFTVMHKSLRVVVPK